MNDQSTSVGPFHIETEIRRGAVVVAPVGEIDLSTVYAFDAALRRAEARRPTAVVVDLRHLEFIDRMGLRALLSATRRARAGRWRLIVVQGGMQIARLLEITALDRRLELVRDPEEALRRASASPAGRPDGSRGPMDGDGR